MFSSSFVVLMNKTNAITNFMNIFDCPFGFSKVYLYDLYVDAITLISSNYKEEFEDTKGVIRIRISKKNRQHND